MVIASGRNIKPSQKEIDEAVKKAEESYEIAYASLFSKDIAPFNPERFKHEIQSPLTLEDVKDFILQFVSREGRKVTESNDGMFEFLLPDSLKGVEGLKRRWVKVTFDRAIAIRNSEAEFMAIGHPFTNTVLKYCGSVDFGGLANSKAIPHSPLVPVFVRDDATIDSKATQAIESAPTEAHMPSKLTGILADTESLFEKAKVEALAQCAQYQPWDEDVFCVNGLRVEVV